MITAIIIVHMIICFLLIGIILIQAGRGGGLVENLSSVESMFGTKTNAFLTRTTTIMSILFFVTCLSLALLSARQSRSLMKGAKMEPQAAAPANSTSQAVASAAAEAVKTVPASEPPKVK
jgi:preprotein translocase subunit SecG